MSGYKRPRPRTKYCGVYAIRCLVDGRMYVGGSKDITNRWTHHRFKLRRGSHKTPALQNHWNLHGQGNFEFVVLERCSESDLIDRENYWIQKTTDRLNWGDCVNPAHRGTSDTKKEASIRRWARAEYRKKREGFLNNRDSAGRFLPNTAHGPRMD